jgi:glycosyltransferase involved in cell wall biosynthesis
VTVTVTVYNKAGFVEQTVASALGQSYGNLEVVAVDNASTDGSLDILRRMAAADPRLRVVAHPVNLGVAASRNRALAEARGEFVNMLDGDDLLYPDFVARTVQTLADNPGCEIAHVSWDRVDHEGRRLGGFTAPDSDDYLRDLLLANMFAPSAVMFRKSLLDRVGDVRDGLATEDWEYFIRCAKAGARFLRLPEVLAAYREAPASRRRESATQRDRFFPVIDLVFDGTMPEAYESLKGVTTLRHHIYLMEDYLAWGLPDEAAAQFDQALDLVARGVVAHPSHYRYVRAFLTRMPLARRIAFLRAMVRGKAAPQALGVAGWLVRRAARNMLGRGC